MVAYGKYVARRYDSDRVRLSHVYMQTKGRKRSSKSTTLAAVEELEERWPAIESVARTIQDLAREDDITKIPPALHSCTAFKGCSFAGRCPKTNQQTAQQIFGRVTAMSLLPPQTQTPDVALAVQKLQSAEIPKPPPGFSEALAFIQVEGYGRPKVTGEAAKFYALSNGWALDPSGEYLGEGIAAGAVISNPDDMIRLAHEVAGHRGKQFTVTQTPPAVPSVLPPDAPESKPELAAKPVEGFTPPPAQPAAVVADELAQDIAQDQSYPAPTESEDLTQSEAMRKCIKAAETQKWGPVKKPEIAQAFTELLNAPREAVDLEAPPPVVTVGDRPPVELFVDCYAPGTIDLAPWIDSMCESLCKQYGAKDLRCAPKDGPLGYGAWKGALSAFARENTLEPGRYSLITKGSEIREVVAEALAPLIVARGF
jgi:hypothetical protein